MTNVKGDTMDRELAGWKRALLRQGWSDEQVEKLMEECLAGAGLTNGPALGTPASLTDLAAQVNAAHRACQAALGEGLSRAIEAGRLLLEAKGRLPHGRWLPWLREHCTVPERTAQLYMQVARELPGKSATVADLSLRGALAALAAPKDDAGPEHLRLADQWGAPPFTVLDGRQGYWTERKREWFRLGIRGEDGRDDDLLGLDIGQQYGMPGSSIFDPVLAELMLKWFCIPGGHVLDPFAGESVKGLVAAHLGFRYSGVEVRPEQVAANRAQVLEVAPKLMPTWVCGNSGRLNDFLPQGEMYDMVFTSPPYHNLEKYSGGPRDASGLPTYREFLAFYGKVMEQAVPRLKQSRFLVVKVGEIRDEKGECRNFLGHTIQLFLDLGLAYWNDFILVTPIGTMPLRAGRQFRRSRKAVRGHQYVLAFFKGDPRAIPREFPDMPRAEQDGRGKEGTR